MRSAWIIPIHGTLPWEDSTPTLILDSSEIVPPSGPALDVSLNRQDRRITWTHASLISFWNVLLAIRHAKTLGPISVSFNATSSHNFSIVSGRSSGNRETDLEDISKTSPPVMFRTILFMVDHIKVYHNMACTMHLRNALDAWSYQYRAEGGLGGGPGSELKAGTEVNGGDGKRQKELSSVADTKTRNIRMLKGAVLVLVDDSSNGVLFS